MGVALLPVRSFRLSHSLSVYLSGISLSSSFFANIFVLPEFMPAIIKGYMLEDSSLDDTISSKGG